MDASIYGEMIKTFAKGLKLVVITAIVVSLGAGVLVGYLLPHH